MVLILFESLRAVPILLLGDLGPLKYQLKWTAKTRREIVDRNRWALWNNGPSRSDAPVLGSQRHKTMGVRHNLFSKSFPRLVRLTRFFYKLALLFPQYHRDLFLAVERDLNALDAKIAHRRKALQTVATLTKFFNPVSFSVRDELATNPRLNVVLPGLSVRSLSGGPNTILNLACRVARAGIPVRLIAVDVPFTFAELDGIWKHISFLTGIAVRLANVELVDATDRSNPVQIGANDVFMATAWWTAQMVKGALKHTRAKEFIYMIQDYEPAIYPLSTQYALALETYSLNYRPVINSSLLAEYFMTHGIGNFSDPCFIARGTVFEPAVDRTKFYPVARPRDAPKTCLVYARPTSGIRNLYEIAVLALNECAADGVFSHRAWNLRFIGEQLPPMLLDDGTVIVSAPWGSHEENTSLMRGADLVVSLILSSHPSYVPVEAAACGAVVVTNQFLNKTAKKLAQISPNFVVADATQESVAVAIREAVRRVETGQIEHGHPVRLPLSWDEAFLKTVPDVISMFRDCVGIGGVAKGSPMAK